MIDKSLERCYNAVAGLLDFIGNYFVIISTYMTVTLLLGSEIDQAAK
jgi:hypothetical protein